MAGSNTGTMISAETVIIGGAGTADPRHGSSASLLQHLGAGRIVQVDKRRAGQRARFASHMAREMARISELEEWQDERFAEMDAEVEVHGRGRKGFMRRRRRETIQRVPSLSEALEKSSDQIILLEGEPGSGKSVALRHVAVRTALRAKDHPSEAGVIPIYVNLKEFRPVAEVDAGAVRDFVWAAINRANDRNVERFLDQEFDRGIEEGTWLFLFDSFDEIPAVLGAVEADDVIEQYANAVYDFLTGMSACRGVIATREFRGPKQISWPRFRVLRLTDKQRRDLIEKLDLSRDAERRLLAGLAIADPAVRALADNPLFLALLCEYQRSEEQLPDSSHVVFENYVAKRFHDDSRRLMNRFGMPPSSVRLVAEQAAYCMAAQPGLGLSPARSVLIEGMRLAGFSVDTQTTTALDALENLRLARTEASAGGHADSFTFAHRRFQEYFATCLVMREGLRVAPFSLLTDGRWRETSVTLFQTQDEESIQPLLRQAERLLADMMAAADISGSHENLTVHHGAKCVSTDLKGNASEPAFEWPSGSLHLLGLLQDGFPSGDHRRSPIAESMAGCLLTSAMDRGQLHDRRWAVESCMAAEAGTARDVLRAAFKSGSAWLREAAYAQAGRLDEVPDDLRQEMRTVLAGLAAGGRLRQQRLAIDAQLQRLPNSGPERFLERVFLVAPLVDVILCGVLGIICVAAYDWRWPAVVLVTGFVLVGYFGFYVDRSARHIDAEARYSGSLAWLYGIVEAITGRIRANPIAWVGLFIRTLALLEVTGALFVVRRSPWMTTVIWLTYLFVLTWGPAANRADRILNKPTLLKVVVLPLAWLAHSWHQVVEALKRLVKNLFTTLKKTLIALKNMPNGKKVLILSSGALVAYIIYASYRFFNKIFADAANAILAGCLIIASASLIIQSLRAILRNFSSLLSDQKMMKKIDCGDFSYASFADMLRVLSLLHTERAILLFVQKAKRQRVPMEYPPALRALQSFAILSQPGGAHPTLPAAITARMNANEREEVQHWIEHCEKKKRKAVVNQAIIDEIGKIVAETELARVRGVLTQE